MFPLSQSTGYAVRALACLQGPGGPPVLVEEVAAFTGIPRCYLSKLVHRLAKQGLLIARQGHHGGVVLAKPLAEIRLEDLSDAVDGASWRNRGLMRLLAYTQNAHCVHPESLPETLIQLATSWRSLTIADLVQSCDPGFEGFQESHWKPGQTTYLGARLSTETRLAASQRRSGAGSRALN
jgi:Rrf2 family protein